MLNVIPLDQHEISMKLHSYLSLAVLCVAGCADNSAKPLAGAQTATVDNSATSSRADERQSFGDFSFSIPSGWTVVTPDRDKTKAMLLLQGQRA